jgi:HK97 family phage portal protein
MTELDTWKKLLGGKGAYKARPKKIAPPYIATEVSPVDNVLTFSFNETDYEELATRVSWIYSNITRISREVSAAPLWLYNYADNAKVETHEFYDIVKKPNPFFSMTTLLEYTIWSLMLSNEGAFWYLAPDSKNKNEIVEIWPITAERLEPVKDSNQFISHYIYTSRNRLGEKTSVTIPTKYIVRFFFPHPFDYWKSLTPLTASKYAIDIYTAIGSSQSTLFSEGGGVPLSLVMLDKNISEPDFQTTKHMIREDWENKRRIAVARGGTVDVKNIGISNRDLEVIASQNLNRNEIDSIFSIIPWRSDAFLTGEGMREANKQIKEFVIYPIHKLIASQIQVHFITKFYEDDDYYLQFDDVRQQDKALRIQEYNVEWRVKTLNEARTDIGLEPYSAELLDIVGELPVSLANNAQFLMALINMNRQDAMIAQGINPDDPTGSQDLASSTGVGDIADDRIPPSTTGVGNLPGSMAPEMTTNMIAAGDKTIENNTTVNAIKAGILSELKTYETVVLRVVKRKGKAAHEVEFGTDIIPDHIMSKALELLENKINDSDIRDVFGILKEIVTNG